MSLTAPGSVLLLAHARDRGAVTAARALRQAGWSVGVGCPRADGGLLGSSRAAERVHVIPRPSSPADYFVRSLHHVQQAHAYDVVVGSGDDWMAALSYYSEQLPMRVAHPPPAVVARALDKLELAALAHEVGLASPATIPATPSNVDTCPLPIVVKSRAHWAPGQSRRHRVEAKVCRTREELRAHLKGFTAAADEPVLQEYARGDLAALIGVMHQGRLSGRVQQISPRLWPTPSGASARAITVPLQQELADRAEHLLRRLGWTGLVELQFLVDEAGHHRLIDLNGRYFGSLALSETARPGLVAASTRALLGMPVEALSEGRAGLRYQWLPGDLRRAASERRGGLSRDVVQSLRWAVGARHSLARVDDTGPVLRLVSGRVRADPGDGSIARVSANVPA